MLIFLGIPDGEECIFNEDAIDDVIERIRELQSDLEDREIVSQLREFVVPCAAGLVCRRQTLDRSVCVPENMNGQFLACMWLGERSNPCLKLLNYE